MAQAAKRPCAAPGCAALVKSGRCETHTRVFQRAQKKAYTPPWGKWYAMPIWKKRLRPGQLARQPVCEMCAAHSIITAASVVDHVKPHRGNWDLFVDAGNLQSLCPSCHSRKTAQETWGEGG